MCSCVSGEVLRQCSAANPADIYVPSMTVLYRLKRKIPFYILIFMPVLTLLFVRLCVYYIFFKTIKQEMIYIYIKENNTSKKQQVSKNDLSY